MVNLETRARFDIMADILNVTRKGATEVVIRREAKLTHQQFNIYLKNLLNSGLLIEENETYKIEDKGLKFLKVYKGLQETLKA